MIRQRIVALCLLCAIGFWAGRAAAEPSYQYVFDATAYSVNPGGTTPVNVYLQETFGGGDTSVLAPSGYGMYGTGVKVSWTGTAAVPSTAAISSNSEFWFVTKEATSSYASLSEGWPTGTTVHGDQYAPGVYRLLIGTFLFTSGAAVGEVTTLAPSVFGADLNVVNDDPYNPTALDSRIGAAARATITVTPEPSTIVLLSFAALALFAPRYWKRRSL